MPEAAPAAPNAALANNDPGKAPPAPPAPEQAAAPKPGDVGTPEWLNPRLEQAKRSARADLLKEIGADDPEVLKKALSESKARADAEKTASEKLAVAEKAREKAEKDAETYKAALASRADAEVSQLTPEQQAFVAKQGGTDPAKRLAAIEDVRALLGSAKPPEPKPAEKKPEEQAAKPAPEAKKPLPAPASTAPGGAPPGGQPPAPVDHLAVLERLDQTNPMAAGRYFDKHRAEITRLRAQKTAASASQ